MKRLALVSSLIAFAFPGVALAKRAPSDLARLETLAMKMDQANQNKKLTFNASDQTNVCQVKAGTCDSYSYRYSARYTDYNDVSTWQMHVTRNLNGYITDTILDHGSGWTRSNMNSQLYRPDCFTPIQLEDQSESMSFLQDNFPPAVLLILNSISDAELSGTAVHLKVSRSAGMTNYQWSVNTSSRDELSSRKSSGTYKMTVDQNSLPTSFDARIHDVSQDAVYGHSDTMVHSHAVGSYSHAPVNLSLSVPVCAS